MANLVYMLKTYFFHFHTHGTRSMSSPTPTDMPEEGKDEGVRKAVPGEDANVSGEDAKMLTYLAKILTYRCGAVGVPLRNVY